VTATTACVLRGTHAYGLPIIAVLGVGQYGNPSNYLGTGASWANPQNLGAMAEVNVVERVKYPLHEWDSHHRCLGTRRQERGRPRVRRVGPVEARAKDSAGRSGGHGQQGNGSTADL
jgi:hypothetical protein